MIVLSMSLPSPASNRIAIIGCGALSTDLSSVCEDLRSVDGPVFDLYPLPPLLHNSPKQIAPQVEALVLELQPRYSSIAIAYADCGTYGALDEVCKRYGLNRLAGNHCYDVYAGAAVIAELADQEPGTYFLTDFLVLGFDRLVWHELGLDRHPELRDDYFRHYTRAVWLTSKRTKDLERAATQAAKKLGLPLQIREQPSELKQALTKALAAAPHQFSAE